MEDLVDATEVLHNKDESEHHFRFIGTAKGRQFVVNVQFASQNGQTGEDLQPVEYDFLIGKILSLLQAHIADNPNRALH